MFLRQSAVGREPLAVTMIGLRMGERALQVGVDDARISAALAAKTGLTGNTTIVVGDEPAAVRVRTGLAQGDALADVNVSSLQSLPYDDGAFDVVVIHTVGGFLEALTSEARAKTLRECWRVLRAGGRAIALEAGSATGLRALLGGTKHDTPYQAAGGTVAALQTAGFKAVRTLGDREGYRFIEGLKS